MSVDILSNIERNALSMTLLQDKVALVTGAASGIGEATAQLFAREGATVVVVDLNEEQGEDTARQIKDDGGEAIFVRADVGNEADVQAMIQQTVDTYGRIDCAFNNAGIGGEAAGTHEQTLETFNDVIRVNLTGVFLCVKYELQQMLQQGGGAIVNTSSLAGIGGVAGLSPYAASKHGVIGITKTAAMEYGEAGIRLNAITPGVIRTPMLEGALQIDPHMFDPQIAATPLGRMGKPEEVGELVIWLCSDHARFVTGQVIGVDGGIRAS
jgi:NAD(P)-dependent dehydrogenase (short-subunit alcohol dehydrogenase family)